MNQHWLEELMAQNIQGGGFNGVQVKFLFSFLKSSKFSLTCHLRLNISKMKLFVKIANGWKPLTIFAKGYILDVGMVLNTSLISAKDTDQKSNENLSIFSQGS